MPSVSDVRRAAGAVYSAPGPRQALAACLADARRASRHQHDLGQHVATVLRSSIAHGNLQQAARASRTAPIAAPISSEVCSEVRKNLRRPPLMGTPGGKIGEAFMSWSNSRASTLPSLKVLPMITGTIPNPWAPAVSKPAARDWDRKRALLARRRATRSGSASSTLSAANAAAAIGGGKPTE